MEPRPKIRLELNRADKVVEITGWVTLISIWILVTLNYSDLPDIIPIHYNVEGIADRFGDKANILILPLIATTFFIGLTILNKFPHIFNYPTTITENNASRQYGNATRMIRYLKLMLAVVLGLIAFKTIQNAGGQTDGLGIWFLPFMLSVIFVPLAYFIIKSLKSKLK